MKKIFKYSNPEFGFLIYILFLLHKWFNQLWIYHYAKHSRPSAWVSGKVQENWEGGVLWKSDYAVGPAEVGEADEGKIQVLKVGQPWYEKQKY